MLLLLLRGLEAHQKITGSLDSMLAARQSVSGPQTRLAHFCGQNLLKGSGPPPCGSPCAAALALLCARSYRNLQSERVCCFALEGYPPTTPGVLLSFGNICKASSTREVVYYKFRVMTSIKRNTSRKITPGVVYLPVRMGGILRNLGYIPVYHTISGK